jgi:Zn-dependent protease with chaperone function
MSNARGGTMDFFGHQERARSATRWLLVLFTLAVAAIVACIYFAATVLIVAADGGRLWQPEVLLVAAAGTLLVVGLATAFKTAQLRSGGGKVAQLLGGRRVDPSTTDPQERVLRNLVEEMAIASGVPVPDVYVLDGESGLNAFAAGWQPNDAAIAVTRGCLDHLDRDELQGVVAHEFSHVFHGDMRLNIRLMGVLFGIVCIATFGRVIVRSVGRAPVRSSGGKKGGGAAGILMFGVALVVIGYLGVFFARLIQAAVSRQREFLADASAVQYTRNPRGIGMALAKIGGLGAQLQTPEAETASHMLFADGVPRLFGGLLATHPPLRDRVTRILPGAAVLLARGTPLATAAATAPLPPLSSALGGSPSPSGAMAVAGFLGSVGAPQPEHLAAAQGLLRHLPLEVLSAAREPQRAHALVLALLLDGEPARRRAQLDELVQANPAIGHDTAVLATALRSAAHAARLPLLDLAVPALRQLPAADRRTLVQTARRLALADGQLQPFEFALLQLLARHGQAHDAPRPRATKVTSLVAHAEAVRLVVGVLAHAGAANDTAAAAAFAAAQRHLGAPALGTLPTRGTTAAEALEAAVADLATVSPLGKRNLLAACAVAAGHDGQIEPAEVELLRALADCFDCPVPLATGATPAAAG